jgi:ATP-dependent Zn protease
MDGQVMVDLPDCLDRLEIINIHAQQVNLAENPA